MPEKSPKKVTAPAVKRQYTWRHVNQTNEERQATSRRNNQNANTSRVGRKSKKRKTRKTRKPRRKRRKSRKRTKRRRRRRSRQRGGGKPNPKEKALIEAAKITEKEIDDLKEKLHSVCSTHLASNVEYNNEMKKMAELKQKLTKQREEQMKLFEIRQEHGSGSNEYKEALQNKDGGKRKSKRTKRMARKSRKPRRKSRKSRRKSRKTTKRRRRRRRRRKSRQRGGSTLGYSMPGVGGSHGKLAPYSIGGRYFGSAAPYAHGK